MRKYIIAGVVMAVGILGLTAGPSIAAALSEDSVGSYHLKDGAVKKVNLSNFLQQQDDRHNAQHQRINDLENIERHADGPYGADLPGQDSSSTTLPAGATTVVWTACAPGEHALSGGFRIGDLANESFATGNVSYPDLQVIATEPAYYKDGVLVNGSVEAPVNDNLAFEPNAWAVTVHNAALSEDSVARAFVVCEG